MVQVGLVDGYVHDELLFMVDNFDKVERARPAVKQTHSFDPPGTSSVSSTMSCASSSCSTSAQVMSRCQHLS